MTQDEFEDTLRRFLRREPFFPFAVERFDGHTILILHRGVAFGGGAATYCSPEREFVEFACEEVRAMRLLTPEAAS